MVANRRHGPTTHRDAPVGPSHLKKIKRDFGLCWRKGRVGRSLWHVGLRGCVMANIEMDSEQVNIRAMGHGELELHVTRTKRMLVATVIASMSIIAVAALFMSLWI